MKEYRYKDIEKIEKHFICFNDGYKISLNECRFEWAKAHNIDFEDNFCIGERDILTKPPFFLFYNKEKVKVVFTNNGILNFGMSKKSFSELHITLMKLGYKTFDMT